MSDLCHGHDCDSVAVVDHDGVLLCGPCGYRVLKREGTR